MAASCAAPKPAWHRSIQGPIACTPSSRFASDAMTSAKAQAWMEAVIGEQLEGNFPGALKNGRVLCRLMNSIRPGTIAKVEASTLPFKEMANISAFLRGCRELGVPEHALFETLAYYDDHILLISAESWIPWSAQPVVSEINPCLSCEGVTETDLYNEKRLPQVIRCLISLAETTHKTMSEPERPHLPSRQRPDVDCDVQPVVDLVKMNSSTPWWHSTAAAAGDLLADTDMCQPNTPRSVHVSTHSHRDEGDPTEPHCSSPVSRAIDNPTRGIDNGERSGGMIASELPTGSSGSEERVAFGATMRGEERVVNGEDVSWGRDPGAPRHEGRQRSWEEALDRTGAEMEVALWIEGVTGITFPGKFWSSLKDGVLLCKVINAVQPGLIPRINKAGSFLSETENIEAFLSACCTLGVAEHSLFKAEDLLEKRDLQVVVRALNILGATVQATVPCFRGPFLGEGKPDTWSNMDVRNLKGMAKDPGVQPGINLPIFADSDDVQKHAGMEGKINVQGVKEEDATVTITPADSPSGNAIFRSANIRMKRETVMHHAAIGTFNRVALETGEPCSRPGLLLRVSSPLRAVSPPHLTCERFANSPDCNALPASLAKGDVVFGSQREQMDLQMANEEGADPQEMNATSTDGNGEIVCVDVVSQVQSFVEFQTRIAWRVKGDMYESLRDGWQLGLLANSLRPGTIRRVYNSILPSKHVHNIGNFLTFCRRMGVARALIFEVPDLYAQQDLGKVGRTLLALRSLASDADFARAMHRASSSMESSFANSAMAKLGVITPFEGASISSKR